MAELSKPFNFKNRDPQVDPVTIEDVERVALEASDAGFGDEVELQDEILDILGLDWRDFNDDGNLPADDPNFPNKYSSNKNKSMNKKAMSDSEWRELHQALVTNTNGDLFTSKNDFRDEARSKGVLHQSHLSSGLSQWIGSLGISDSSKE